MRMGDSAIRPLSEQYLFTNSLIYKEINEGVDASQKIVLRDDNVIQATIFTQYKLLFLRQHNLYVFMP